MPYLRRPNPTSSRMMIRLDMKTAFGWPPWMLLSLLFAAVLTPVNAQVRPELTLEDIYFNDTFSAKRFASGKWAAEGPVVTYTAETADGGSSIVSFDLVADEVTTLIDGSALYADDVERVLKIDDYAFSDDGSKILLYTDSEKVWRENTKGYYYIFDVASGDLQPLSDRELGFQMFAKLSPDGSRAGFVRNRDIFVVDLESATETRLTRDGSPGGVINGTTDWVYEEEFGLRDAWQWSPDGTHIAFLQLDETRTRDYWLADNRGQYPEFKRFRYPKAGETNSEIQAGAVNVETGEIVFFDTETWYAGGDDFEYLPQIGWTPEINGKPKVWVIRLNRDQNDLDLIYGNPATGSTEIVLNETEPTYLDVEAGSNELDVGKITYLEDGQHFVWISEIDGWKHLYLHMNTGERLGRITEGEWQISDFEGVDEVNGYVYFTATIEHSTERHLYRMPFGINSGEAPERITSGAGWHSSNLSADRQYFIDTYSSLAAPPTVTLRSTDGQELRILEDNAELNNLLAAYDLPQVELTEIPGADGTPLNAYVIKPRTFDPGIPHPLLLYVYGGPGSQRVRNAWQSSRGLFHQYVADRYGIVVVCVDSRGTGGRGKEFQSATYRQLGVIEAQDFIAAAKNLGAEPYIDQSRIGVWGWSYGGFMTLNSMFMGDGPEVFKLGVAIAPVADWRQYDTIYTERYMSTPQKNEEGYRVSAPINYVDRMSTQQRLLIAHGTGDDNVHFQNSVQLVEALQKAGKQFEFMIYPAKTHSISGADAQFHLDLFSIRFLRVVQHEVFAERDGGRSLVVDCVNSGFGCPGANDVSNRNHKQSTE